MLGGVRKAGGELRVAFGGDVEAVEAVEPGEAVIGGEEDGLPPGMGFGRGHGGGGFGEDDPGAVGGEVGPGEDVLFGAFDVDFEEMDVGRRVVAADRGEGGGFDGGFGDRHAEGAVAGDGGGVEGGEAGFGALDGVEGLAAGLGGEGEAEVEVARAGGGKAAVGGLGGLDVEAVPAAVVEGAGDGVDVGVGGADVDVEASGEVAQRAP